jgi:hypothetical protein
MRADQIRGLIVTFLILAIIPFFIFFSNIFFDYKIPVLADQNNNSLTLELRDKDTGGGIYFTAPGTTANQLFALTGINFRMEKDFLIENTMQLTIDPDSEKKVSLAVIDNPRRLALGMPIDLNLATKDDLLLIPGIGEITAEKILTLRNRKNRFRNIEELMEIDGIKEKKLARLKQYLYLNK